ncbi:MAG TPA: NTP transferase domain-containing protein [Candidatus Avibacteroides excrementipullorum]|jgi:NDP-sugar pyrophosphorylase family protein|nr:NTP transferase domain-containing protein [Candidatus Avibacteroides excrementipullorum]
MNFAIIAAGNGSRLAQEGIKSPKPLIRINGEIMIERLVRIFLKAGASSVIIIINDKTEETKLALESMAEKYSIRLVVKSTPSSMHSFYELSPYITDDRFCLTTVDTIFKEEEFLAYIDRFRQSDADGIMAVTDFIDDEKPLYISTNKNMDITAFKDRQENDCNYISGGIYCLKAKALDTLRKCMAEGKSHMRNFQRELLSDGMHLKAYPFSKILDIDHASDIEKAETFLKQS